MLDLAFEFAVWELGEKMRSVLDLFKQRTTDRTLELEFRVSYQETGVHYLFLGSILGAFGFGAFYLLDTYAGKPAVGLIQAVRVLTTIVLLGNAIFLKASKSAATHYKLIANITLSAAFLIAMWVTNENHGRGPAENLMFNANTSMSIAILVVVGASRLTLANTVTILLVGVGSGFAVLFAHAVPLQGISRVAVNLSMVTAVAMTFRIRGENREWDLFILAKENFNNSEGNKTKMRFLANMSHEVRTPVVGLLQIMEIVSAKATLDDQRLIFTAKASANALLNILDGILDYSALNTAAGTQVTNGPTNLTAICRTAASLHTAAISVKGLEFRVRMDLGPTDARVLSDEVMLFEILNNLISNSIKFTEHGSLLLNVELRPASTPHPHAVFSIELADTGIGISDENLARIFTPFYQVDTSTSRKVGGTGLGLSIVKSLVEVLGGTVQATSKLGVGTTMRVEVPVTVLYDRAEESETTRFDDSLPLKRDLTSTKEATERKRLDGRILLVEDNEVNSYLYSRYLTSLGLEVETAIDGQEGLDQFLRSSFDVILMDCLMPVMDGYEATRQIRLRERTDSRKQTPIIAFTANNLAGVHERCLAAGMNDHYAKGLDNSLLRALLVKWLPSDEFVETV